MAGPVIVQVVWDAAIQQRFARDSAQVRAGMDRLAGRAVVAMKRAIPVSKVQRVYATGGATVEGGTRYPGDFPLRPSGYLRSSVTAVRLASGDILVGPLAPYGRWVNEGTPPHVIRSTGPWPLRNRATGQVFGPLVHHPGTAPSFFVQRAAATLQGVVIRI